MSCEFGIERERECSLKAEDARAAIERRGRLARNLFRLSALMHHPANGNRTLAEILKLQIEEYCANCEYANMKAPGSATEPATHFVLHAVPDNELIDPAEPQDVVEAVHQEQDRVVVFADFGSK